MATEDLLKAEARERPRMAVAAALAAIFTLGAPVVGGLVLTDTPDNAIGAALNQRAHQTGLTVSIALSVLGLISVILVLDFLYRAIKARNPDLPPQFRPLAWIGGLGLAALTIGIHVATSSKLEQFATDSSLTYDEAKAVSDYGAVAFFVISAQLAFAFAIVMVSINAMRVGLMTRFLGYLGVISGVLFIMPLIRIPIVQVYWLGALAALFMGRMRGGLTPAWLSGESVPWPSPAEMRDARVRAAEERRGGLDPEMTAPDDASSLEQDSATSGAARRKRKKRR